MLLQAGAVVCIVGLLSWWAVAELHKPPAVPTAASQQSAHPTAPGGTPGSSSTLEAGLGPVTSGTSGSAAAPGAASGGVSISGLDIYLEGGSKSVEQVDAYVSFNASSDGAITLTIQYYGSSGGEKTPVQTALFPESGHTSYQIPVVISSGVYCGKTVTVIATVGGVSSQSSTESGC
jgi:hypothetical protein